MPVYSLGAWFRAEVVYLSKNGHPPRYQPGLVYSNYAINKSPKIPHSTMVKKVENGSGIHIWDRITTER